MYDPDANEVAPFEEFMGSHGGLGGWQSHPFALVPSGWSEPAGADRRGQGDARHDPRLACRVGLALRPHASA